MGAGSTGDDRWWRDFDDFVLGPPDGPSRILDVGSGDGSLGQRLREAGHEVVGVDPNALDELAIRARIEEVEPAALGRFDLVCASMALHHIDLRARSTRSRWCSFPTASSSSTSSTGQPTTRAPRPGSTSRRAATRSSTSRRSTRTCTPAAPCWKAIGARFALREEQPRPYLARMLRRPEREPDERAAIAAGRVPALGFWLVAAQPSAPPDGGAGPV